jgi:toxoflavin biosynthesis protein ToxC
MSLWTRHLGPVTSVAHVPHTRTVVTAGYDGAVGLFDLEQGTARLLGHHQHLVNHVTVDRSGRWAASSSSDYTIQLWDLRRGGVGRVLRGHSDDLEEFCFADDHFGVSAGLDGQVIVWSLQTGAIVNVLKGHDGYVKAVAHHAGRIYSAGFDRTLRVWDLRSGAPLHTFGPFKLHTDSCAIDAPRGRVILG